MPIELVCFGFGILGGLIGMLLFCLIWDYGFHSGHKQGESTVTSHHRSPQETTE